MLQGRQGLPRAATPTKACQDHKACKVRKACKAVRSHYVAILLLLPCEYTLPSGPRHPLFCVYLGYSGYILQQQSTAIISCYTLKARCEVYKAQGIRKACKACRPPVCRPFRSTISPCGPVIRGMPGIPGTDNSCPNRAGTEDPRTR